MIRGKFYKCISVLILYRRRRFINHLLTYLLISPPLQRAQNEAARLILRLAPHDHVTVALRHLHWLPVQYRITYKLCLLMHLIHIHKAPSYLIDTVTRTASVSSRGRLRSASSSRYEQPRIRLK